MTQVTSFTYDALNRRVTATDPRGQVTTTAYDNNGNVLSDVSPGGTRNFTYTPDNMIKTVTGGASALSYTYDADLLRIQRTEAGISTYFWILSNRKPPALRKKVILLDARDQWVKMRKSLGDKRKMISDEQIVAIIRETDRDTVPEVAKRHKISEQSIYTWKKRFGVLQPDDVRRLKRFEQENARLKKLLAERDLEIEVMKEIAAKKW